VNLARPTAALARISPFSADRRCSTDEVRRLEDLLPQRFLTRCTLHPDESRSTGAQRPLRIASSRFARRLQHAHDALSLGDKHVVGALDGH
jgi:hypothetical protein